MTQGASRPEVSLESVPRGRVRSRIDLALQRRKPFAVPVIAFERCARVDASRCGYCRRRMGANWIWQLTHPDGGRSYACNPCFEQKRRA